MKLENVTLDMLGEVKKLSSKKKTRPSLKAQEQKLPSKRRISSTSNVRSKRALPTTIKRNFKNACKTRGGVAVIRVGAATEIEMKEKKDRVDDAQHATEAAVEEGISPGGGVALLRSIPALEKLANSYEGDVKTGIKIIMKAITSPLRQIAENAGQEGSIIVQGVLQLPETHGYDALKGEYVDMYKAGILDPTKVVRCAIENAVSIAALLLTTEAIISDHPEEKAVHAPAMDY